MEISPFVEVSNIEEEDFSDWEDLSHDDPVCEMDSTNTINTPLGNLHPSQADRIYLNSGGIRFNNQSRKGRVATKSRRKLFDETAFSDYLNPVKCCEAALCPGDVAVLSKCVKGKASKRRIEGSVRFMSKKLTPVSVACRLHSNKGVNIWLWEPKTKNYVRCSL